MYGKRVPPEEIFGVVLQVDVRLEYPFIFVQGRKDFTFQIKMSELTKGLMSGVSNGVMVHHCSQDIDQYIG